LLNTHTDNEKGNGQHHRVLSVSFCTLGMSII